MGEQVFVDCRKGGFLLCIGNKDEVDNAPPAKLAQMIFEAIAVSEFREIDKSPKLTH